MIRSLSNVLTYIFGVVFRITMANVTVRQTWNFAIAVGVKMAIMTYKMLTSVDVNVSKLYPEAVLTVHFMS